MSSPGSSDAVIRPWLPENRRVDLALPGLQSSWNLQRKSRLERRAAFRGPHGPAASLTTLAAEGGIVNLSKLPDDTQQSWLRAGGTDA